MSEISITGRAELDNIYKSLKALNEHANAAMTEIGSLGKRTNDTLERTSKKTETSIKNTGGLLRRVASNLYSDFKALLSLQAALGAFKLSNQFTGALRESVELSDTVRRLGNSFGIARDQFGKFQAELARGLGDIGVSADATAQALQGLTGIGLKDRGAIKNMVVGATTLSGIGGEKGNEKQVAGLLGQVLQASGKDVNDVKAQQELIGEVTAAVEVTGKSASEILTTMNDIFQKMPKELRQKIGPEALAQLATVSATVGPDATKAIQEYLSKTKEERLGMEAQGFNVFKDGKLDLDALQKFIKSTESRGLSPRAGLKTVGFSDEAAEGLVRIAEKSKQVKGNLDNLTKATRDNIQKFKETMGMLDAFKGSINTIKGRIEEQLEGVSQVITDFLAAQVGDAAGSAAVVGGAAVVSAVLVGTVKDSLKNIFGPMVGRVLGTKLGEQMIGEDVQKVFVVNPGDIAAAQAVTGGIAGKIGPKQVVGGVVAGAVGYEIGEKVVNPLLDKYTTDKTDEGFEGNAAERFFFKMDKYFGGEKSAAIVRGEKSIKVEVHTKAPNLNPVNRMRSPPKN